MLPTEELIVLADDGHVGAGVDPFRGVAAKSDRVGPGFQLRDLSLRLDVADQFTLGIVRVAIGHGTKLQVAAALQRGGKRDGLTANLDCRIDQLCFGVRQSFDRTQITLHLPAFRQVVVPELEGLEFAVIHPEGCGTRLSNWNASAPPNC